MKDLATQFYDALSKWSEEKFNDDCYVEKSDATVPDTTIAKIEMIRTTEWCEEMMKRHSIPEWFDEIHARATKNPSISPELIRAITRGVFSREYEEVTLKDKKNTITLALIIENATDDEINLINKNTNTGGSTTMNNVPSKVTTAGGLNFQTLAQGTIKGINIKNFINTRLGSIPNTGISIRAAQSSAPDKIPFTLVLVEVPYNKAITNKQPTTYNEAMKAIAPIDAALIDGVKDFMFDKDFVDRNMRRSNNDAEYSRTLSNIGLDAELMSKIMTMREWTRYDVPPTSPYDDVQEQIIGIALDVKKIMNEMLKSTDGKQFIYNFKIMGGKFYNVNNGSYSNYRNDDDFEYKWFGTFDPSESVSFEPHAYRSVRLNRLI